MKLIFSVILAVILAVALRPASAEQSQQPSLPSKLIEQMAELPAKLQQIDDSIALMQTIDGYHNEEIDKVNAKVDALEVKFAELSKPKVVEVAKPVPVAPVVKVETPRVSVAVGGYSQPDGYKSQWTYPGDIATHVNTVHGISVAGKSKEQLEREHDAAHNGSRVSVATQSVVVSRPLVQRSVTRTVSSNCPGGVCPSPSVSVRVWRPFWRR
jgi:hypothetical protein